jgi:hypothetical protein
MDINLKKAVYKILSQSAKIEVLEYLLKIVQEKGIAKEIEETLTEFCSSRQKLTEKSELCLELILLEKSSLLINQSLSDLQNSVFIVTNFLIAFNSITLNSDASGIDTNPLINLYSKVIDELLSSNKIIEAYLQNQTSTDNFIGSLDPQPKTHNISTDSVNWVSSYKSNEFRIPTENSLKNLLNKCRGNHEQAERLIMYEQQRNSSLSRDSAIQCAISRWESDNR